MSLFQNLAIGVLFSISKYLGRDDLHVFERVIDDYVFLAVCLDRTCIHVPSHVEVFILATNV